MNKVPKGYKMTEVGVIPEDWAVKKLEFVAPLQRGFDLPNPQLKEGIYPVVYSNGIGNYHNSFMVKAPGVITGRSGTLGKVNYVTEDYWPHNTALWVTKFFNNHPLFIYYLLIRTKLERFGTGSGVPTLNRNDVHDFKVPLPSLPEQISIAEALSDTDTLIGKLEELITKKRQTKQGAMQELLTGKKRLPGFSGKWEEKTLGKIAEVKDGTHQTPRYVDSGIPFYSVESVTKNDFNNTKYISEEEHLFLTKSYKIEKGDILMTRIGSIGDCKYVDWDVNASFYVSLALLKIKKDFSAKFICHYSKSAFFKKETELNSLQSAIPKKINLGQISNIKLEIPKTLEEQSAIAAILSDMDTEIEHLEKKLEKYKMVKTGMMQELLTGKTRLI